MPYGLDSQNMSTHTQHVHAAYMATWRYLLRLWPLLAIFWGSQVFEAIGGVHASLNMSVWATVGDMLLFFIAFAGTAIWVFSPVSRFAALWKRREGRVRMLVNVAMGALPARAFRGFLMAGFIFSTYLMITAALMASSYGVTLTWRMLASLALTSYFGMGLLTAMLAVAITLAYMVSLREKLVASGFFQDDLDEVRPIRALLSISRRPWVMFIFTGLVPTTLLATYAYLALGMSNEAEQAFIIVQATILFFFSLMTSIGITYSIGSTMRRITGELTKGLNYLRQGNFSGRVAVLLDDDMGQLARGLNTALSGLQEREDLKDSLKIAAEIQQGLLPSEAPKVPGYAMHGFQQSCYSVGGDYYDHILLPDGRIWLVVADVAGKGYPAALTVANLQAMLRGMAFLNLPIEEAASYINNTLCETLAGGRFVTMFLAKLQPKAHTIFWLNAGHMPGLVVGDKKVVSLEASSPPLGLSPNIQFPVSCQAMTPGDMLFAYSDGVTDARGRKNGEVFGEERLKAWLKENRDRSLEALPETLLASLAAFGSSSRDDDITILCARRDKS